MSEPRLPTIYQDPYLRQDHFDQLSSQMRKLYLETYPESPRHQPAESVPLEKLPLTRKARGKNKRLHKVLVWPPTTR